MPARLADVLLQAEEPLGQHLLRTEAELRNVPFLPERCQVLYGGGGGGCTGLTSEECVVAYKNQVIWTAGQAVRKRFTASSDILQVCWANFGSQASNASHTSTAARQASSTNGARRTSSGTAGPSPAPSGAAGGIPSLDATGGNSNQTPALWPSNGPAQGGAGGSHAAMQTPASAVQTAAAGSAAGAPTGAGAVAGAGADGGGLIGSKDAASSSAVPVTEAVLCLLLRNSISCIFPTGELLECPLLQPCQALWPLPTGVILAGPSEAFASVLTHPLEEPLPVVADCSLSTAASNGRGMGHLNISTPAAYAGWSQERVVWSSRELPFVATHNEDRARLSIWHIRPQPAGAAAIGSAYDLPALSPFGLGPMRTPIHAVAAALGAVGTTGSLPTFGTVNSAGAAAAGTQAAGLGSAGAYGAAAAAAAGAAAGYVGGPAADSGSMLGMLASGGVTPWSGPGSFARMSVGASTVKRSGLRSPAGRLPASIFSATPNPQNLISGALGALGPLRPAFSNTTTAQQALLLPGPDPSLLFKLLCRQDLAGGLLPDSAVQATDAAGQPLLCVLCSAAQQLLAFQLPGDSEGSPLLVKPAFSIAALTAVPITTGACARQPAEGTSTSSSAGSSSGSMQLIDLLVLQPDGQLVLHRGPAALATVRLLLPHGHLQQLQEKLAAAAAVRYRAQQQQLQQLEGSPALGGRPDGSRRSSGMQDAEVVTPTGTDVHRMGQASGASICGLSGASGDRFDVQLQLGTTQVSLRARLGVSWLPGLPSQVLQALGEVLDTPCFNRLLAACLTQQGACCGELSAEWRVIATVLLAWALQPECLEAITSSSRTTSSQPSRQQQQQRAGSASPTTPRAATGTAADEPDTDMEMATPAAAVQAAGAAAAPARTPQQQQYLQTPGSEMDMSVDMAMSVDTASAATPVTQLGPGRFQRELSGTPMSVTSKVASRLRHQSSYRQEAFGQQQQQQAPPLQQQQLQHQQQHMGMERRQLGYDAAEVFPTATPAAVATPPSAAETAAVAAAQQRFGQLQLPQTPQLAPQAAAAAEVAPENAWQELLQSAESSCLLQQLPGLRSAQQAAAPAGHQQLRQQQDTPAQGSQQQLQPQLQPQQQQRHRHDVVMVLLALHSVYQDCKLSRLRLHLLQLLGPVCWLLAVWLNAPVYREQYEREGAHGGVAAASAAYVSAVETLLAAVGSSSFAGALWVQPHLAAAGRSNVAGSPAAAAAGGNAVQQQQDMADAEQLLQQPLGDILKCLSLLLSASQQYQQYVPFLAGRGSTAVLKSLELLQVYKVLAGCASKCADAIAADAAERLSGSSQMPATVRASEWLHRSGGSQQQAALVAQLQHVLMQCSQRLVMLLVEQGWDVLALDQVPVGVALPIKEALARCRGSPPVGWPVMAYALIGREDIAATLASSSSTPTATCTTALLTDKPQGSTADKPAQPQPFDLGSIVHAAQESHRQVQHLLLPFEQRLLLPSGSFLTGQQHHQRLPPAAGRAAAGGAGRRGAQHSRAGHARGLRSSGTSAGAAFAANAAAGGAAGGAGTAAAAGGKAGVLGGEIVPIDGMEGLVNGVSALRFSRDDRLAEARSLLGTNMPVLMQAAVSESDPELPAKQQASLLTAAMRTMSLPLGRGALTLGLAEPLPGEHVVVPLLCLSGAVPCPAGENGPSSGRIMVNLDLTNAQPAPGGGAAAEVTAWCEFHNGVAAGLKITPYNSSRSKQQQQGQQAGAGSSGGMASSREGNGSESLSESWLPHSKPSVPNYAHAGVLLALGLNGHLSRLSWTDLYRYLSDQHDATTIGVLLGMSAACRGTADSTVARMLFLHLPARHPNTFPEIELSPHVQAASLLGLGLLYQGSCHRLMTETVLEEMCRTPGVNPHAGAGPGQDSSALTGASLSALMSVTHDREAYALAAGFGLGLICLGQGRSAPGLADLHLEDRLRNLMDAQAQPHTMARTPPAAKAAADANKPGGSSSSTGPGGSTARNLLDHVLGPGVVPWSVEAGDDPTGLAAAAAAAGGFKIDADQMQQYGISQVVLEGPVVNTAGTGPGAAMALMMMYLKTGDAGVAARFKVPDTAYALDHMRPDMVLLMVLGRSLIMWDTIEPTEDWLHSQLSTLLDHPLQTILDNQASPPAPQGSGSSGGGSGEQGSRAAGGQQQAAVDWGAVGLAHVNAISGGCFALGLRFAGTCSAQAEFLLRGQLLALLSAKRRAPGGSTSNAVAAATAAAAAGVATGASFGVGYLPPSAACIGQLDKAALEDAIVVVLLSLSLVMAGSGHLPTFRLIQMLSRRVAAPLRPPSQAATPDGQPGGPIAAVLGGAGVGTNSLHYGHHLAVSLAAGLLFLSGGRSSLSTSNEAIAALLIALYPVWPCTPTDQRCHLQAFRHLYALAAEPRCLEALDVHSRRQVVVPLSVTARTAGLAGAAAAAAHHKQQQQQQQQSQRQSLLSQRRQLAASAAGVVGVVGQVAGAVAEAAATHPGSAKQGSDEPGESTGDAMMWSPRSAEKSGGPGSAAPCAQQQHLPPPAFAFPKAPGTSTHRPGVAITPALKPGLPPLAPSGGAAGAAGVGGAAGSSAGAATAGSGSNEAAEDTVSLRLQAPCLLPEQQHLVSLRVCGPRYWAVELAAEASSSGSNGGWSQQHLQHRICVKKKAGSLSYTDDHTGVKSLLFKAFYAGGSDDILAAAAAEGGSDAAAAAEAGDDEIDGVQLNASGKGVPREQRQQHSFDITHLCQTFAADPQIQAFAQVLQAANAAAAGGKRSSVSRRFLSFCNGALYECVVQEKTGTLPAYLQLHALVQQVCASALAAGQSADAGGDSSGSSSRMRRAGSNGGSSSSGGSAALGCVAPVGAGLLLQDLMLVLHHYGSSMSVAAGLCRTAQLRGAQGAVGGSMQQRELAEVDMLMWQPLLQPGFCASLFTTLMQFWRAAGVLPQELGLSGHSSDASSAAPGDGVAGAGAGSMLSRYVTAGSIRAAAETAQAPGASDGQCVQLQQEREQLLAGCLAALQLPAAVHLQELRAALSDQHQQSPQGEGELQGRAAAAVLALLTGPQGCAAVQDVPARSLMVLAAALREVLLVSS